LPCSVQFIAFKLVEVPSEHTKRFVQLLFGIFSDVSRTLFPFKTVRISGFDRKKKFFCIPTKFATGLRFSKYCSIPIHKFDDLHCRPQGIAAFIEVLCDEQNNKFEIFFAFLTRFQCCVTKDYCFARNYGTSGQSLAFVSFC